MRYFLSTLILFFSCTPLPEDIPGCTNSNACNFNPDANEDDGSCIQNPDPCGTCDNDSTNNCIKDCIGEFCIAGEIGCLIGTGVIEDDGTQIGYDGCGICGGNNSSCTDCDDVPNGPNIRDMCGTCDSDSSNDCFEDCAGIWGGNTTEEECDACTSGVFDCAGDCDGTCVGCDCFGECGGDNWGCTDCAGVPNGLNLVDECGTCDSDPSNNCSMDCLAVWGGTAVEDECEVCDDNPSNDCVRGCTNSNACNFNPEANYDDGSCSNITDCLNICGGPNLIDCLGICGGGAYVDPCGFCDANTENDCSVEVECFAILSQLSIDDVIYECDQTETVNGYFCNDLKVIQNIINNNPGSINILMDANDNKIISALEYGDQLWIDGRLVSLDLNYDETITPTFCEFKLDTLPANIGELDALKTLILNNNKIGALPEEIGDLDNLEKLILVSNILKTFPESIGNLEKLEILYAHHNQITSLPSSFVELTNLQVLWLHFNDLSFLPDNLGNMINLVQLYLHNNQIEEIPSSIGELESLIEINLDNNQLNTLPDNICNLGVDINGGLIINLSISNNKTCPIYPPCVDKILGYQDCVECTSGFLIGDGSTDEDGMDSECLNIGDWQALQDIIYANDVYSGLRPIDIVDYSKWSKIEGSNRLNELILNSEGLTGKIPESIGNLDNLKTLLLEGNRIIGGIPSSIGNLHLIQEIKLNSNKLGCFEYDDFNGYCITHCDDSNGCSGKLPDNLTTLAELEILNLKDNYFTQIPEGMNNLTKLRKLKLKNNLFRGVLPLEIFDITTLTWLDVSWNQFTGAIPENINELEDMTYLNFSYNQLSGIIPEDICALISLNQVYFNSNQFCPPYPECIISQVGYQDTSLCTE